MPTTVLWELVWVLWVYRLAQTTCISGIVLTNLTVSYLPLAHSYERATMAAMVHFGVPVAFYRGDVTLLFEDIGEIRPTIFCSVPRLYNRIYSAILAKTLHSGSSITAALFSRGLAAKLEGLKSGSLTHAIWDRVLFNKIKNVLGGRVRMMMSGSAPISADVIAALRCCFSCEVLEGFGQTGMHTYLIDRDCRGRIRESDW
jgi:long-chain acyl-CoA synthetase